MTRELVLAAIALLPFLVLWLALEFDGWYYGRRQWRRSRKRRPGFIDDDWDHAAW